jgi:hypothetical protein
MDCAPHFSLTKNFHQHFESQRKIQLNILLSRQNRIFTPARQIKLNKGDSALSTRNLFIKLKMPARTKDEQPQAEDTNMEDAPASAQPVANDEENEDEEEEEEEEEIDPQRVRIVSKLQDFHAM